MQEECSFWDGRSIFEELVEIAATEVYGLRKKSSHRFRTKQSLTSQALQNSGK